MLKIEESQIKQSSFFQKFSGRVNKVPRLGINAVLLREEFEQEIGLKMGLPHAKNNYLSREKSTNLFKARQPIPIDPLPQKLRVEELDPEVWSESKILQRHPSERLPLINQSDQLTREGRERPRLREKMKSEQNRKESPGSVKYRGWKYPPRLSEKALRFFAFADEGRTGQNSARN